MFFFDDFFVTAEQVATKMLNFISTFLDDKNHLKMTKHGSNRTTTNYYYYQEISLIFNFPFKNYRKSSTTLMILKSLSFFLNYLKRIHIFQIFSQEISRASQMKNFQLLH